MFLSASEWAGVSDDVTCLTSNRRNDVTQILFPSAGLPARPLWSASSRLTSRTVDFQCLRALLLHRGSELHRSRRQRFFPAGSRPPRTLSGPFPCRLAASVPLPGRIDEGCAVPLIT